MIVTYLMAFLINSSFIFYMNIKITNNLRIYYMTNLFKLSVFLFFPPFLADLWQGGDGEEEKKWQIFSILRKKELFLNEKFSINSEHIFIFYFLFFIFYFLFFIFYFLFFIFYFLFFIFYFND
jgi:hypothetical protein